MANRVSKVLRRLMESRRLGWIGLAIALLAPFVSATDYSLSVMTSAALFVMLAIALLNFVTRRVLRGRAGVDLSQGL